MLRIGWRLRHTQSNSQRPRTHCWSWGFWTRTEDVWRKLDDYSRISGISLVALYEFDNRNTLSKHMLSSGVRLNFPQAQSMSIIENAFIRAVLRRMGSIEWWGIFRRDTSSDVSLELGYMSAEWTFRPRHRLDRMSTKSSTNDWLVVMVNLSLLITDKRRFSRLELGRVFHTAFGRSSFR